MLITVHFTSRHFSGAEGEPCLILLLLSGRINVHLPVLPFFPFAFLLSRLPDTLQRPVSSKSSTVRTFRFLKTNVVLLDAFLTCIFQEFIPNAHFALHTSHMLALSHHFFFEHSDTVELCTHSPSITILFFCSSTFRRGFVLAFVSCMSFQPDRTLSPFRHCLCFLHTTVTLAISSHLSLAIFAAVFAVVMLPPSPRPTLIYVPSTQCELLNEYKRKKETGHFVALFICFDQVRTRLIRPVLAHKSCKSMRVSCFTFTLRSSRIINRQQQREFHLFFFLLGFERHSFDVSRSFCFSLSADSGCWPFRTLSGLFCLVARFKVVYSCRPLLGKMTVRSAECARFFSSIAFSAVFGQFPSNRIIFTLVNVDSILEKCP